MKNQFELKGQKRSKPDATYESDREIIMSEIIDVQRKMDSLAQSLQQAIKRGADFASLKESLDQNMDELILLENALKKLREISGPISQEPVSQEEEEKKLSAVN